MQETSVEAIYTATDKLMAASGDAGEMVKQARLLGQATAQLIQSIKGGTQIKKFTIVVLCRSYH